MTRAVGFIDDWKPQTKTEALINAVQRILVDYRAYGPMTVRQIFYRLVATVAFPKTERDYKALAETLQKARRARIIAFSAIRDDGDTVLEPPGYQSIEEVLGIFRYTVEHYRLRRDIGQPVRIIVITEASGMAPMVATTAHRYGAVVQSAGGFNGVTGKHALAENIVSAWEDESCPTVILHVGDHDPSGEHVFLNLERDVSAFVEEMTFGEEGVVAFERIAVTPRQIVDLGLPTAPAKTTDRRSFSGVGDDPNATVQAEAIDPATLSDIVETAILRHWDEDAALAVIVQEEDDRMVLQRWLAARP